MSNDVTVYHAEHAAAEAFTPSQLELLKSTVAQGLTDDEFQLFAAVARRTGLDPFKRQIYAIKRGDKLTIQTGIDGYRCLAESSGKYDGQAGPYWCGPDGEWRDIWLHKDTPPSAARVGVYRIGRHEPVYGIAIWDEYVQTNRDGKPANMWATMPAHMLAKCAEALALRKALPNELSGIYTEDEMGQAENTPRPVRVSVQAPPPPPRQPGRPTPPIGTVRNVSGIVVEQVKAAQANAGVESRDIAAYLRADGVEFEGLTQRLIEAEVRDRGVTPQQFVENIAEWKLEQPSIEEQLETRPALGG